MVVGVVALIAIVGAAFWFMRRRYKKQASQPTTQPVSAYPDPSQGYASVPNPNGVSAYPSYQESKGYYNPAQQNSEVYQHNYQPNELPADQVREPVELASGRKVAELPELVDRPR